VTELEQRLRDTYAERLEALDLSMGDVAGARRTGARMRTRRRLVVGAAAVAVVAVAIGSSLVGTGRISVGPSHTTGDWRELPAAPLSPRGDSLAVWTGHEVIVLGGQRTPCPPNADCAVAAEDLRDGAAYDPDAGSWRKIATAPVPVGSGDRLVQVGDQVVLRQWFQGGSDWYVYDPRADRWSPMHGVPEHAGDLPSAVGSDLYVLAGRRVAHYSAVTGRWNLLPPDPLTPRLVGRRVTATSSGVVVTGVDATAPSGGDKPSPIIADVYDTSADAQAPPHWRRLPITGQVANNMWSWTGTRMVDPEPYELDGGQVNNWGHSYPDGGILDPRSGAWKPLPEALVDPPDRGSAWSLSAAGGTWFAVGGLAYDDDTGRVYTIERPDRSLSYATSAAWADRRLLVFGGATFDKGGSKVTNRAWLWTP
jgi:hypothetical protein